MSLILSAKDENQFQPCPAGSHHATCIRIIDLGTQKTEFQNEVKLQHKILIQWEIDPQGDPEMMMSDGRPYIVSKRYTASLHSKSQLSADLKSWRGRDFTPQERDAFDLKAILGKPCLLSIAHQESSDKSTVYANIAGISNKMRGYEAPAPNNEVFAFDLSEPDWGKFALLHDKIKEQITKSPEYAELNRTPEQSGTPPRPPEKRPATQEPQPVEDIDDDIPF